MAQSLDDENPTILRMKNDPATPSTKNKPRKVDFLSRLRPGDHVYTQLGGAGNNLILAARAHGARVFRYPSFLLGDESVNDMLEGHTIPAERARGKETGDELTARKKLALGLFHLADADFDGFTETDEQDVTMLQLQIAYNAFHTLQQVHLKSIQGLVAAYRDMAVVELGLSRQESAKVTGEDIYNFVLERLMEDILGGEISKDQRALFKARMGTIFDGKTLPDHVTGEQIEKLISTIVETDELFSTVLARMKGMGKRIQKLLNGGRLKKMPGETRARKIPANEIFTKVFQPIPGMGDLISARIISAIGDIRAFGTHSQLVAYAGYHHRPDGSRARRSKGHASNWNMTLKQGVYLFAKQTLRTKVIKNPFYDEDVEGSEKTMLNPWRIALDMRKAYELYKLLDARQIDSDAEGHGYTILPEAFVDMDVTNFASFTVADYATLAEHVDQMRKQAGVKAGSSHDEDDDEDKDVVKDAVLAKYCAGLKQTAQDKGFRWLGQQLLKYIWDEWNHAVSRTEKRKKLRMLQNHLDDMTSDRLAAK